MKYNFIVNPHSRSGKGGMIWEILEPELKKRQIDYKGFLTEYPGHAITLAQQITGDAQEHMIVILGGDGTVNEVVNGIEDVEKVTLGYIPTGSSNDLARGLGLPKEPLEALDVVLNSGRTQKMDIGLLIRGGKERRFAVSAGIGFDAAVCHQAAISGLKVLLNRLKLGKLTYVAIALGRLFCDNPIRAKITLDDKEAKTFEKVYFAAAMNNSYEGGGFRFCPNAGNNDGLLDVIVISKLPKLAVLLLLPTAYKGWHTHFPGIFIFRCRKVTIEAEEALAVHTDGEPIFMRKKITARLLGKQIRVIMA